MSFEGICQIPNCNKKATNLVGTETNIIEVCKDHWHEKYGK